MNRFSAPSLKNLLSRVSGETGATLVFLGCLYSRERSLVRVRAAWRDGGFFPEPQQEILLPGEVIGSSGTDTRIFEFQGSLKERWTDSLEWKDRDCSWLLGMHLPTEEDIPDGILLACFPGKTGEADVQRKQFESFVPWASAEYHHIQERELLRKIRRQLELAEERALFGSWHLDLHSLELSAASRGILRLLDWHEGDSEAFGLDLFLKRVHPGDRLTMKTLVEELRQGRVPEQFPVFRIYIQGLWKYLEIWGEITRDPSGLPAGFDGSFRDVTETRNFEEVFKESEKDREVILEAFEEGGALIDRDFCFRWVSGVFLRLLEVPQIGIIGKSCFQFFPGNPDPESRANYLESIFSHGLTSTWDYEIHGRTLTFTGSPVRDEAGRINGAVLVVKDITRKRLMEHQWIQARSIETVSRVARTITHELNNQLAVILGTAENLQDKSGNLRKEDLRQIFKAVENSRLFLQKLASYSRSNPAGFIQINLNQLLENIRSLMEEWIPDSVSLVFRVPSREIFFIRGDRNFLHNCLLNLCYNISTLLKSGTIRISLEEQPSGSSLPRDDAREEGMVAIRIEDDGDSPEEGRLAAFFAPSAYLGVLDDFLEPDFTEIQDTLEIHGGGLHFENLRTRGKRFTLSFPLEMKKLLENTGDLGMEENRTEAKILVVEDESVVRKILEMQISSFGYQVATAALPGLGIEYFQENFRDIDLVLLDMNMPEMDGLTVFRKMKEIDPGVNVLVLSGYSQHGKIEAALKEGVLDYMTKPVRKAQLAEKIREILEKKKSSLNPGPEKGEPDELPLLDEEFLTDQFSVSPGLKEKVVESFLVTAPGLLEDLRQAVAEEDWEKTAYSAHKCYGPVTSIGGARAASCIKAVEEASGAGSPEGIPSLMAALETAMAGLLEGLKKHQAPEDK